MDGSSFPARIAQRRRALGLSQQEVATRMGAQGTSVSHQTVWKWETGAATPKQDKLAGLAAALVVTVDTVTAWWLGQEDVPSPSTSRSPWDGLFDELSDDARAAIEHIVALDRAARRTQAPSPTPRTRRASQRQDAYPRLDL